MKDQIKNRLLPALIIAILLTLVGFTTYFLNSQVSGSSVHKSEVLGTATTSPTLTPLPTNTASPSAFPSTSPSPQPTRTTILKPTPSPSPTPTTTPQTQTSITYNYITQVVASPTPSPTPTETPSPTPIPSIINVEIKDPAGDTTFTVQAEDGINACDLLTKAKDQGKINSVTLDDSYLKTFNTLLVKEINGFSDYWTFTVNGQSPDGCSLVTLKNGDQVVWTFDTSGGGN